MRNRRATVMDITTWAREYFRKPLSLNTVRCCIRKRNLELYCAKRKAFINFTQKCHRVLWALSHLRWTERRWKRLLWSDESTFQLFLRKMDVGFYVPKMGGKKGVHLHICEGAIDAEAYVGISERHMLQSRQRFFPGTPCLFEQDNARPHSARVTTAWLLGLECVCLTGLPAVQICLQLNMYGAS